MLNPIEFESMTDESAMQLLERDISKRLGYKGMGGIDVFKAHPWFQGLDWARLERKQIKPPFEPDVSTLLSLTLASANLPTSHPKSKKANFDATHELEELLLEDNPLKARKRNPNVDINALSADMRLMEEAYTPYDHTVMQRKSHFVEKEHGATTSQTASSATAVAVGLEQQPLAEMTSTLPSQQGYHVDDATRSGGPL